MWNEQRRGRRRFDPADVAALWPAAGTAVPAPLAELESGLEGRWDRAVPQLDAWPGGALAGRRYLP